MIRVLIVEDSKVMQEYLTYLIDQDPHLETAAVMNDGREAVDYLAESDVDVVLMDLNMPRMNGFDATRAIMASNPVPIVLITASWDPDEVRKSFMAMEAGALALMEKPAGLRDPAAEECAKELLLTLRLMSEVPVVRRRRRIPNDAAVLERRARESNSIELVAIGASTGGPPVLCEILTHLAGKRHVPIVIVQHISKGFVPGMVGWIRDSLGTRVLVPAHNEPLQTGVIYIAPDDLHIGVRPNGHAVLAADEPVNGHRPSVSKLFESVANSYGPRAAAVILTGMGADGANELKQIHDAGGVTIAQNKDSSVVFGMPGRAIELGAAKHVLDPGGIGRLLARIAIPPKPDIGTGFASRTSN